MKNSAIAAGLSVSALACAVAGLMLLGETTAAQSITPRAPGIWRSAEASHKLSAAHEEQLVASLRYLSGLPGLHFAAHGALALGDIAAAEGGSAAARQMLMCALGSGFVFIIEDHSNSATVNFGQMDEGTNYEDMAAGLRLLIWRVRLDFHDFRRMQAPREVRASFNVGFTMLHELLHGLGLQDATHIDEVGECEELVNETRAELGLPLRDQYFGEPMRLAPKLTSVRLRFRSNATATPRAAALPAQSRKQYLFFLLPPGYESRGNLGDAVKLDCRK